MAFYVGAFSKPIDPSRIIHIKDPLQAETLQNGDVVEKWDLIFEWDSDCLKGSKLEEWRSRGDPLCDEALQYMFSSTASSTGVDLLDRLQTDAASVPGGASQILLDNVSRSPPDDIAASPSELREAQAFFLQHSVAIMQCLMHFSLAGGFASPRITRVLQSVSYLVPPSRNSNLSQLAGITPEMNDRTYSRLLETLQFVLEVMGCTNTETGRAKGESKPVSYLDPGGDGWKAALRVRLLHGVARRRIMDRLNFSTSSYSLADDGIPINQEDLAATLGSFCAAPILCLTRLYLFPFPSPPSSQVSSFIAAWRHIGFYLGVDPAILRKHFASPQVATKFLASTIVHLLTIDPPRPGFPRPSFPTIPILLATSDRPPVPRSFEHNCALTRHLLGPSLSDHLGIPQTPLKVELRLLLRLAIAQIPVLFSCVYPRRGWSRKRAALTREALARMVRFQLGMRRTTFRARTEGGEVGEDVLSVEAVKADPAGAKKLVKEYKGLMMEMAGVMAGGAVLLIGCVAGFYARFVGWDWGFPSKFIS